MRATKSPVAMTERVINQNVGPVWSRDGQQLAYYSFLQISADTRTRSARDSIDEHRRRTNSSSSDTSIVALGAGPKWFPDTRSVLVESGDAEGPGSGSID